MSRLYSAAATLISAVVVVVVAVAASSVGGAFQPQQPRPQIISTHHPHAASSRSIIVIPPSSSSSSSSTIQGQHFLTTARQHCSFFRPSSSTSSSTTALLALPAFDELIFNAQRAASDLAATSIPGASSAASSGGATSTSALAATLTPTSLAILYFAGLLTSFSPCSISLLPLTISYISQSTGEREDKTSLLPTLAFAAGLASVFVGLGLSVALLGGVFGATTQGSGQSVSLGKIVLATLSSGVSIAMGLQLLELVTIPLPSFELDVPTFDTDDGGDGGDDGGDAPANVIGVEGEEMGAAISFDEDGNLVPVLESASASSTATGADSTPTSKSTSTSSSASLLRTFLLGGSSALIASPCATPVLTSILAFVASSQNPTIGAALLFTYTLGYSTPLLVVGATGGQALANAQVAAASSSGDGDGGDGGGGGVTSMAKIGKFVTPLTASVLIWYGTTGFLEALFGDPSLAALAPIMD